MKLFICFAFCFISACSNAMFLTLKGPNTKIPLSQYVFTQKDIAIVRKRLLNAFTIDQNNLIHISQIFDDLHQAKGHKETPSVDQLLLEQRNPFWDKKFADNRLEMLEQLGTDKDLKFINNVLQNIVGKTKKEIDNEIGRILDEHNLNYLNVDCTDKRVMSNEHITLNVPPTYYFRIITLNNLVLLLLKFCIIYPTKDKKA